MPRVSYTSLCLIEYPPIQQNSTNNSETAIFFFVNVATDYKEIRIRIQQKWENIPHSGESCFKLAGLSPLGLLNFSRYFPEADSATSSSSLKSKTSRPLLGELFIAEARRFRIGARSRRVNQSLQTRKFEEIVEIFPPLFFLLTGRKEMGTKIETQLGARFRGLKPCPNFLLQMGQLRVD